MEVDFSSKGGATPAPVIEQPITSTTGVGGEQPTHQTHSDPVVPGQQLAPNGLQLGDKLPSFSEIILPRINIVQGSGQLKDRFPFGSLVFDAASGGGSVLYTMPDIDKQTGNVKRAGTKPAIVTVLGFRPTRYAEKVSGGAPGMIVATEDLVRAAGGTLDYNEWKLKASSGMKRFEYLAEAVVVVERPETIADDDTIFVYAVDGKKYALGLWSLKGSSYTAAAKRVFFTHRQNGCLRLGGYPSYSYNVSTRVETREGNSYAVPVCLPHQKSSPAFLEFAKSILVGN
jgi:hypothetical protein